MKEKTTYWGTSSQFNAKLKLTSDVINGKLFDTKISIVFRDKEIELLWISGEEITSFIDEFNELLNKYRI